MAKIDWEKGVSEARDALLEAMAATPEGRAKMRDALGCIDDSHDDLLEARRDLQAVRCSLEAQRREIRLLQEQVRQGQLRILDLQKDVEDARAARPRAGIPARALASGLDHLAQTYEAGEAMALGIVDSQAQFDRLVAASGALGASIGQRMPSRVAWNDLGTTIHVDPDTPTAPIDVAEDVDALFRPTDTTRDPAMQPASAELVRKTVDEALAKAGCSYLVGNVSEARVDSAGFVFRTVSVWQRSACGYGVAIRVGVSDMSDLYDGARECVAAAAALPPPTTPKSDPEIVFGMLGVPE